MYKRLITFVEQYEILYCYQFGFRKNHSNSMALIHLVNKITSAIDRKETTAGVFLDLSKAFDTIGTKVTNFLLILRKQIILFLNLIGRLLLLTFLSALVIN